MKTYRIVITNKDHPDKTVGYTNAKHWKIALANAIHRPECIGITNDRIHVVEEPQPRESAIPIPISIPITNENGKSKC